MPLLSRGANIRPWSEPRSSSTAKDLFSPRIPAKAKATHRSPGAKRAVSIGASSKAKLKTKVTTRAKTSMELSISLVRSSARMSFQTMAVTFLRYALTSGSDQVPVFAPQFVFGEGPLSRLVCDTPFDQHGHPRSAPEGSWAIMGSQEDGPPACGDLQQDAFEELSR